MSQNLMNMVVTYVVSPDILALLDAEQASILLHIEANDFEWGNRFSFALVKGFLSYFHIRSTKAVNRAVNWALKFQSSLFFH